ncbi:MAG TPA: NfeD family protein [Solirubrobacteraceae bacterium]|nr:NfeD family protein [Solirubrobacteraceae bacterium]
MDWWIVWLVAAALLGAGEMHTGGFYLLPFATGAGVAAIVSVAGAPFGISVVAFVIVSALIVALLRPVARSHRQQPPAIRTGASALIGRPATVLERIANSEGVGCVRIDGGEVWTARSFDDDVVIDAGAQVQVVEIRGATALVMQ